MCQALREIQQLICRLNSTLHSNSQSETVAPYQQASLDVLANIADDVSECLIWLRTMGSRHEAIPRPEQQALQSGASDKTAPGPRSENAMTGDHQIISGASPPDGLSGVAPPIVYHARGPSEAPTEAGQLQGQTGGYAYHLHPEIDPQAYPYVQSQLPFPPSPGLYQTQWVQSPPVSPLVPSSFWHQHNQHRRPFVDTDRHHIRSAAMFRGREVVPPPPNTTPNDTHQGTPLHGGQGRQRQQQSFFPSSGTGVTMSLPLYYETPVGPRMTLYNSCLPGYHSDLSSPQPVFRELVQSPVASSAAVQELAAETPPPSQVSMGLNEHWSSAHPSESFARVDSDSEDSLDSPEEADFRWSDAFEEAFSS